MVVNKSFFKIKAKKKNFPRNENDLQLFDGKRETEKEKGKRICYVLIEE